MKKRILCFGDSNIWGYVPISGTRYEKEIRWTGRLGTMLGDDYEVIEEGMCGRTTAFGDKIELGTCALDYLYPCLISQFPLDTIIIMLGTNDAKTRYGVNATEIGYGMDELLLLLEQTCKRKRQTPRVIIVSPMDVRPVPEWEEFTQESCKKIQGLRIEYEKIAEEHQAIFLNAQVVMNENCIGADGIHLTAEGHKKMAEMLVKCLKK